MQAMEQPPYWSNAMPERVSNREEIPDVETLQQHYVRYSSCSGAVETQVGWQKQASLDAQAQLPGVTDSPGMQAAAPERIIMEIVRAPAEFAVPVKQDRRLKPAFKLRVRLWHKAAVCLPVAVTAHAIVQEEFLNLEHWIPPAIDAAVTGEMVERSTPTELKGTTSLTHQFEAQAITSEGFASMNGVPNAGPQGSGASSSHRAAAGNGYYPGATGGMGQQGAEAMQQGTMGGILPYEWTQALHTLVDDSALGTSGGFRGVSGELDMYDFGAPGRQYSDQYGEPGFGGGVQGMASGGVGMQQEAPMITAEPLSMISHDFDFEKLEFAKPSRMNKVYIVFACQVSNLDLFFTVFTVPTICFCRREQKDRAYGKLGIPFRPNNATPAPSGRGAPAQARARPQPSNHDYEPTAGKKVKGEGADTATEASASAVADPFASILDMDPTMDTGDRTSHSHDATSMGGVRYSEKDVTDLINERYQATGLSRPLTQMDRDALLQRFGFPQMGRSDGLPPTITQEQFDEFARDWELILLLLQKIHHCWVAESPAHIVSGFEMDHVRAISALRNQPPGTFLCRLSYSQPGDIVLVCKVPPNSPNADADCLVHGLLNVHDLQDRRFDVWITDFPGATHLLDVYCNKRVDKRKAFPSQYARLEQLEERYRPQ